jgi:hypothetical protein
MDITYDNLTVLRAWAERGEINVEVRLPSGKTAVLEGFRIKEMNVQEDRPREMYLGETFQGTQFSRMSWNERVRLSLESERTHLDEAVYETFRRRYR